MKIRNITASLFVAVFIMTGLVSAQMSGRKILSMPKVEVPEAAKQTRMGGKVTVVVTVDKTGKVIYVGPATGPDHACEQIVREDVVALREAAREAAKNVIYEPAASGYGDASFLLNFTFTGDNTLFDLKTPVKSEGSANYQVAPDRTVSDSNKYTIKGNPNSTATLDPPAIYSGPVNNSSGAGVAVSDGTKNNENTVAAKLNGRTFSGGVLNGKAIKLVKPVYPAAARAVNAQGAVSVQILINEDGQILAATPISGHPLLRHSSQIAACGSEYQPTTLLGSPVKVMGVITYNYIAP